MANLGTLTLDLVAKIGGFTGPIDKAERKTTKASRKIAKEQARLRKQMKETAKQAGKWGAAMAGAAAAGAVAMVKSSVDATAEMGRNAKMAGITVEAYQELEYVARQYQVTTDALTDGMKELSLRGEEFATTGAGSAAEAFERLGYTQDELNEKLKDAPALFEEIVGKLHDVDKAAQIRISDELFGGQGGEQFTALIDGGSEAMKRMKNEAHDLGLVMSADMVEQTTQAKIEVDNLSKVITSQFAIGVADTIPELKAMADELFGVTEEGDGVINFSEVVSKGLKGLVTVVIGVAAAFDLAGTAIGQVAFALGQVATGDLKGAASTLKGMGGDLTETYNKYAKAIDALWTDAPKKAEIGFGKIKALAEGMKKDASKFELIDIEVATGKGFDKATAKKIAELQRAIAVDEARSIIDPAKINELKSLLAGGRPGRDVGRTGGGGGSKEVVDALAEEVMALNEEYEALLRNEKEQKEYQSLKDAGVVANSAEGAQIIDLVAKIEQQTAAIEAQTEAEKAAQEATKLFTEKKLALDEEYDALLRNDFQQEKYLALKAAGVEARTAEGAQIISLVAKLKLKREAQEETNRLQAEGITLTNEMRTSSEQFGDEIDRISELQRAGAIDAETYNRAVAGMVDAINFSDAPGTQKKSASQKADLDAWYSDQMETLNQYRSERADLTAEWDERELQINKQYAERNKQIERERFKDFETALADTFVAGFKGQVDSIEDIWKNLLSNMYNELVSKLALMAAQKILFGGEGGGGLAGLFGGKGSGGGGSDASAVADIAMMFAADGGLFNGSLNQVSGALADGGVGFKKSHWQLFEKGPEAVIPLSNPKAIKPIVNALGGGGGGVVNNYQTVYANDAKSFREQMAQHTDMMQAESARVVRRSAPGAVANNVARRGVMSKVLGG